MHEPLSFLISRTQTPSDDDQSEGGDAPDETRRRRARKNVEYDDTGQRLENDGSAEGGAAELELRVNDFDDIYPDSIGDETAAKHARNLSTVTTHPADANRLSDVAAVARQHAEANVPPSAYLATYMSAFEELVDDAFANLTSGANREQTRDELLAAMRNAMVDMQVGVDEFADGMASPSEESAETMTIADVFEAIPRPAFLVDDEHTVLEYNVGLSRLLNLEDSHREFLGRDNRETIAAASYADGRRHRSLVDKVVENPRDAEVEWDIERVDEDNEYTDQIVYQDTSVTKTEGGTETHIRFLAIPIFGESDQLKGVLELVEDRTDEIRHQQELAALVGEVTDTIEQIGDGNLSARAHYEDDHDIVENELLNLTEEINLMAQNFQTLVEEVDETTEGLTSAVKRATDRIDNQATEQRDSLTDIANEMENFSATMEEVAASSSEVVDSAEQALTAADEGVAAGEDAHDATTEIAELSEELVATVEELDGYMEEIGDVAAVISDVAEQTNMLALNANIEAARADGSGDGFAVVADEVKSLATETRTHTEEISERIATIQEQTEETVTKVERSHNSVRTVQDEISDATDALHTISESVEDAVEGMREVADANDEQAATVEQVTAAIENARDNAQEILSTTEEIVTQVNKQEEAVANLSTRVQELSSSESDTADETP